MNDLELDAIEGRYRRALGGVHGEPSRRVLDTGALLAEVKALRKQVNALVAEVEAA